MKNPNSTVLKMNGVFMIIFAVVYAATGTLALCGIIKGVLPGHESQEVVAAVLAYAVALLALICGIICIKGITSIAKIFGILFAIVGLVSLIYMQVTQDTFSIMDCLAAGFGLSIFYFSGKIEKGE